MTRLGGASANASRPRVLVTRAFVPEAVDPFAERLAIVQGRPDAWMPRSELLRRIGTVDGLVAWSADRVDAGLLDAGLHLRIVANFGVGYDSVDVPAATARGVWVSNTPDVLTDATADVALLLLLAALRRAGEAFEHVRHGGWVSVDPYAFWGTDPAGRALGVLGLGRIGGALARRARGLGMRIAYHSRRRAPDLERELDARWLPLEELLRAADALSIHLPLTPETHGLVGRRQLELLPRGAVVVNTARGAVLDTEALCDLIDAGHLAGAGLDVFPDEPRVPPRLREHPRIFCLPHIGSATRDTRLAMMRLCLENVTDLLVRGAPPRNAVNGIHGGDAGQPTSIP